MALYLRQTDPRNELQERVAAELRERLATQADSGDKPDPVDAGVSHDEANYQTSRLAGMIIMLLVMFAIISTIVLLIVL